VGAHGLNIDRINPSFPAVVRSFKDAGKAEIVDEGRLRRTGIGSKLRSAGGKYFAADGIRCDRGAERTQSRDRVGGQAPSVITARHRFFSDAVLAFR
jgi:hypothetical protein